MIILRNDEITKLKACHPDLQRIIEVYCTRGDAIPVHILETSRSILQQQKYVAAGVSHTMKSRHLISANGYCHAVDIAPMVDGRVSFAWPIYYKLAPMIKEAAKILHIPIEWGGDWKKFKDGPHWQLPWKQYPGTRGT